MPAFKTNLLDTPEETVLPQHKIWKCLYHDTENLYIRVGGAPAPRGPVGG
jgi:hypothetical protein